MSSSIIKAPERETYSTGTVNTSYATSARTDYVNKVVKKGNLVFLTLSVGFTNSIATGIFAQVPEGFRPKTSISITASIGAADGKCYPIAATLNTSGVLSQSVVTAKYIMIDTVYEA